MFYGLYSVYDKVAKEYGPLFEAVNDGIAQRKFDSLEAPPIVKKDLELYRCGDFTRTDGRIHFVFPPVKVTRDNPVIPPGFKIEKLNEKEVKQNA